jgi:hypothetical protein
MEIAGTAGLAGDEPGGTVWGAGACAVRSVMALLLVLACSGCIAFGPKRITPDRFSYNASIARSANEQMLLNIVRMRYLEVPVFLSVNSVLTQYVYTGRVGVSGTSGEGTTSFPSWTAGGDASALYIERPTITYSPLVGQEFTQRLLMPISGPQMFSLAQSGWPADMLLMMSLQRVHDAQGFPFNAPPSTAQLDGFAAFRRVIALLPELSGRRAIEMQRLPGGPGAGSRIVFDRTDDPKTQALVRELKGVLGLDPDRAVFRVTERATRREPDEFTLRTRSLSAVMFFLSYGVEVPLEHLDGERAIRMTPGVEREVSATVPLRVRSSAERPRDAFVVVRYQDYWFYITHADYRSKQAFGLLSYLFQLQAPEKPGLGPLLTVPTG